MFFKAVNAFRQTKVAFGLIVLFLAAALCACQKSASVDQKRAEYNTWVNYEAWREREAQPLDFSFPEIAKGAYLVDVDCTAGDCGITYEINLGFPKDYSNATPAELRFVRSALMSVEWMPSQTTKEYKGSLRSQLDEYCPRFYDGELTPISGQTSGTLERGYENERVASVHWFLDYYPSFGIHGFTHVENALYSKATGIRIFFEELFVMDKLPELNALVDQKIRKELNMKPGESFEAYLVDKDYVRATENFLIDANGIFFEYGHYALGERLSPQIKIFFAYDELDGFIRKETLFGSNR